MKLYDNRKRKGEWLDKDEAPKPFPKPDLHPRKIMLSVWWSSKGMIHYSFLPKGKTIDSDRYVQEAAEMLKKLQKVDPYLANRKGPILLQDNARAHVSCK